MTDNKYTPPSGSWSESGKTTQKSIRFPHRIATKVYAVATRKKISFAAAVIHLVEMGLRVESEEQQK